MHKLLLIFSLFSTWVHAQVTFSSRTGFIPLAKEAGKASYGARSMMAADLNKDGLQDLIITHSYDYLVFLAIAPGVFKDSSVTQVFRENDYNSIYKIVEGDFNNDTYPDFLMVTLGSEHYSSATTYINDKTGKFTVGTGIFLGKYAEDAFLVDFNKDDRADLATVVFEGSFPNPANLLKVFTIDAQGNFNLGTTILQNMSGQVFMADLNGDKVADVVQAKQTDTMSVYLSKGSMLDYKKTNYYSPYPILSTITGDVDGDGLLDIVGSEPRKGFVFWKGLPSGLMSAGKRIPDIQAGTHLLTLDLNNDRISEVLCFNDWGTFTHAYFSPNPRSQTYLVNGDNSIRYIIKDMNKDGYPDVLAATDEYPVSFRIIQGNTNNTFQAPTTVDCIDVAVADGNQDGKADLIASHGVFYAQQWLTWYDISPAGEAVPQKTYLVNATKVRTGDLNGDGKDDVVISYMDSLRYSLGKGNFELAPFIKLGKHPNVKQITCKDINGDRRADILVIDGDSLFTYLAAALGGFEAATVQKDRISYAAFPDLDNDGFPDLIHYAPGKFIVALNNRKGGFLKKETLDWYSFPQNIGDFDRDGKEEVVLSSGLSVIIGRWDGQHLNLENGPPIQYPQEMSANATGDFNNDGYDDLSVVHFDEINRTQRTYTSTPNGFLLNNTFLVATSDVGYVADVNGDDLPDLIQHDNYFTIYLNASSPSVLPLIQEIFPRHVVPTTKVLVKGINFTNVSSVRIGDLEAPFEVLDKHTLQLTVPSNAVSGKITVTNGRGTDQSPDSLFVKDPLGIQVAHTVLVHFYPNPTADKLSVSGLAPGTLLEVINAQGCKVLTKRMEQQEEEIDLQVLPNGLYELRSNTQLLGKFVVQK